MRPALGQTTATALLTDVSLTTVRSLVRKETQFFLMKKINKKNYRFHVNQGDKRRPDRLNVIQGDTVRKVGCEAGRHKTSRRM